MCAHVCKVCKVCKVCVCVCVWPVVLLLASCVNASCYPCGVLCCIAVCQTDVSCLKLLVVGGAVC